MKWIGQHIWDFISRFRSDVYLEGTETGTIASGGNLGLDANNKIVKAASGSGDLTITNAGNNRIVTSTGGTGLEAESELTYDASLGVLNLTDTGISQIQIHNSTNNTSDPSIELYNTRGGNEGVNNDDCGTITFHNNNNAGTPEKIQYAYIKANIEERNDGDEAGRLMLNVATSDSSSSQPQQALRATGHSSNNTVDIGLGYGATSTTTVSGHLVVTGTPYVAWHGANRIKILPRDFLTSDDVSVPIAVNDSNIGSNQLFARSFGSSDSFAYVPIPTGYKATHVKVFGSDNGQNFYVYEGDINSKTITDIATGATSIGTEKTLGTQLASDTTNYLIIRVTSDGVDDEIYGGYVTIAIV